MKASNKPWTVVRVGNGPEAIMGRFQHEKRAIAEKRTLDRAANSLPTGAPRYRFEVRLVVAV